MTINFLFKLTNVLNNIVSEAKKNIKNINLDFRESTNSLSDILYYRIAYNNIDKTSTKQSLSSTINFHKRENKYNTKIITDKKNKNKKNKDMCTSNSSLYKKEGRLPVIIYKNIYEYLKKFHDDNFKHDDSVIIIDGVYSNTNILHNGKLETAMSIGLYSKNDHFPYDIHFTGEGKKNNEVIVLEEYIKNNLDYFKGKTIICDRAYYCFRFFKFLLDNDINFIIRIRDESNIESGTIPSKNSKYYKDFMMVKNDATIRILSNVDDNNKNLINNINNDVNIIKKEKIVIVTNLESLSYDKEKIFSLYKSRWDIEEFFKQLKSNFKFQYMDEHKENDYKKNIFSILTIQIIKKIIISYYEKKFKFENKSIISKDKDKIKKFYKNIINEDLIIGGIYNELLEDIICENLNKNKIENFIKSFIIININEENRSFIRKSKRPFTKWYVKQYHEIYKLKKKNLNMAIKSVSSDTDEGRTLLKQLKKNKKELTKDYNNKMKEIVDKLNKK